MNVENDSTFVATSSPSTPCELKDTSDYAFQLQLLKQQIERRKRIKALKETRIAPLSTAATPSAATYYSNIFLDSTVYDDECVEKLLENDAKLYEDLRAAVHVKVPDGKINICFCGYYSATADDLDFHIAANSTDENAVDRLLDRLPATNMCDECQQTMRRTAHGDFTNTWYDGDFSLTDGFLQCELKRK